MGFCKSAFVKKSLSTSSFLGRSKNICSLSFVIGLVPEITDIGFFISFISYVAPHLLHPSAC